jgi:DNA-binding Xre family transcriptional regulator
LTKFSKGESIGLEVLEKLCKVLDCKPENIFEFVEEK